MSTVKVSMVKQAVDPFSGRPIGPPRTIIQHVPTDVDHEPVPDGTIADVLAWVEDSGERARAATMAELQREGGARPSLLRKLEAI